MKLGLFSDPHFCPKDVTCGTRRPALSFGKIREAMEVFRAETVDLVVCLGDLADECGTPEENIAAAEELSAMIRSFGLPVFCVPGNHDYQNFTREEFARYTGGLNAPPSYRTGEGKTLIFLDANCADNGTVYRRNALDWTNAYLTEEQRDILRDALTPEETKEAYVFVHQNLDPTVESHHIIRNAADVREMIRTSGKVKAVFQGHYHPGKESVIDGLPYHTLPAMCEGEENRFFVMEI